MEELPDHHAESGDPSHVPVEAQDELTLPSSPARGHAIGRLYALISAMEGFGSMLAAPGMAVSFRVGISLGDKWMGLPFGFAAVLFAGVAGVVWSLRVDS